MEEKLFPFGPPPADGSSAAPRDTKVATCSAGGGVSASPSNGNSVTLGRCSIRTSNPSIDPVVDGPDGPGINGAPANVLSASPILVADPVALTGR
eukprot:1189455-Prorocentrum_minimum.AAC.2